MSWQPLVGGALRDRAKAQVITIVNQLLAEPVWTRQISPWLAQGAAGIALALDYIDDVLPGRGYGGASADLLEQAIAGLAATEGVGPESYGLFSGYVGVAYATELLAGAALEASADDDANSDIDATLVEILKQPWTGKFDLYSGLVGIGHYLLQRGARPLARRALLLVIEQLAKAAETQSIGMAWRTPPQFLSQSQLRTWPKGYINLGSPHGQYGVLAFLAGACQVAEVAKLAQPLLRGLINWLMAEGRKPPRGGLAVYDQPRDQDQERRAVWCYGDGGAATALFLAGLALQDRELQQEALGLARRASVLSNETAVVRDAGLCHGSAGLLQIYSRLGHESNDPHLLAAAEDWLQRTLAFAHPGTGLGGYWVWDEQVSIASASLLVGATGVALALAGSISEIEPRWDALFQLSRPPP